MSEKIIGYLLITMGMCAIVFSVINIYSVFTKKINPVNFFDSQGISIDTAQITEAAISNKLKETGVNMQKPEKNDQEIVSADLLNNSANLFAQIVLMGFVSTAGYKIASIGTMLARPINVKVKSKTL